MMNEIEVKARVKDLELLRKKLESMGCTFSPEIRQIDRIYIQKGRSIPSETGDNVLRIREQAVRGSEEPSGSRRDGKFLFTLKQTRSNQLDCIEEEMPIDNPDQMIRVITLLGFEESVSVKKTRRKAKYKDYTICLDEVEGAGAYIEVEKMSDEDGPKVQEELFTFLETLEISRDEQETDGYDVILYKKQTSKF
jgi:adenylate cyclase, class 2